MGCCASDNAADSVEESEQPSSIRIRTQQSVDEPEKVVEQPPKTSKSDSLRFVHFQYLCLFIFFNFLLYANVFSVPQAPRARKKSIVEELGSLQMSKFQISY